MHNVLDIHKNMFVHYMCVYVHIHAHGYTYMQYQV
jgi:hypothetical protein